MHEQQHYGPTAGQVQQQQQTPNSYYAPTAYDNAVQPAPPMQQQQSYSSQPQPAYLPPTEGTAPAVGVATGRGPAQDWKVGFWDCCSPAETCKSSRPALVGEGLLSNGR